MIELAPDVSTIVTALPPPGDGASGISRASTRIRLFAIMISSSWRSSVPCCTFTPLMNVPLFEPRSSSVQPSPSFHSLACCRETRMSGTKIWQSERRPMTYSPSLSLYRRPAIGPARNTSDGIAKPRIYHSFSDRREAPRLRLDPSGSGGCTSPVQALGNFIGGSFVPPSGKALISRNPAADGAVVLETGSTAAAAAEAAAAAAAAQPAWSALTFAQRLAHLARFTQEIGARAQALADAVVLETGKLRSEARGEVQTLVNRLDLVKAAMTGDLKPGQVAPGEHLRYQPLGVVGVIGPFNFPLHLCHAHVVPALLAGNTVVVKPSDITPLCGQRYAEAAQAAGLPAGVVNVVVGTGEVGAALVGERAVRGLCFTGSWVVGRRILEAALDRPELLLALELGGKNTCVVLDDCALRQAVHEVVVGGYLSAGQRCTGTERVLVHRKIADRFLAALAPVVAGLRFGHPDDASVFAGPLVNQAALAKLEGALEVARKAGAEPIVPGRRLPGGSYRTASLHRLPDGVHHVPGYTDLEVFGPDLCVEVIDSDDEAIAVIEASPYGFANAVFTGSSARFEHIYARTRSGILNRNRSTNLASPRLPFGGVGKSGNYRPTGAWAARNVASPVAVLENPLGAVTPHPQLAAHLPPYDLDRLAAVHAEEEAAEAARQLTDLLRP